MKSIDRSERRREVGREALAHVDALFRLARHLARNRAEAEDLVQEAFARALDGADGLADASRLRPWLFQVLRRVHLDRCRREGRRPSDPLDESEAAADEPLGGDVELGRLRGVVAEELRAALLALGEDARTVILLDLEGLTETEIAAVVGCAVGTVKSRLSRARATLRRTLADYRSSP